MEERIGDCPLGAKCQEIKDDILYRCPWYVKVRGQDPQSEEALDESRCAIAWMPVLQIEQSLYERQTGAAVESFRNKVVDQNDKLLGTVRGQLPES